MEAPKCRICGERHWSRLCNDVTPKRNSVTPDERNKPVTSNAVTEVAQWMLANDYCTDEAVTLDDHLAGLVAQATSEVAHDLNLEIAKLKRELSEANSAPKLVSKAAERMRKMRERQRAKRGTAPG